MGFRQTVTAAHARMQTTISAPKAKKIRREHVACRDETHSETHSERLTSVASLSTLSAATSLSNQGAQSTPRLSTGTEQIGRECISA